MNNNSEVMNDKQYEFCKEQASFLAKILMDKDIKNVFPVEGNAVFVMETLVILTAGILTMMANEINLNPLTMLHAFCGQTEHTIKAHEKKPLLTLVH